MTKNFFYYFEGRLYINLGPLAAVQRILDCSYTLEEP